MPLGGITGKQYAREEGGGAGAGAGVGGRTATVSSGRLTGRPRSIDADFILRMEQLGLSAHAHSMPYNSTFSGKTAAA